MRHFILVLLSVYFSIDCHAQNYIPLRLDSTYSYSWGIGLHQEIITNEFYSGYSYDANDSLIQLRYPEYRFNYVYLQDTTYHVTERPLPGNQWRESNRSIRTFQNGNLISKIDELNNGVSWEKSARYIHTYSASNQLLVTLLQHWKNDEWVDFYKLENEYDDRGNLLKETKYYAIESTELKFNRAEHYTYDNLNNLIERVNLSSSITGIYFTGKSAWFYQGNQLDSLVTYDYQNNQWKEKFQVKYNYTDPAIVESNHYQRSGNNWNFTGQSRTYKGSEIYSEKPDSIISYSYDDINDLLILSQTNYFTYDELGNDKIYFKEVKYTYIRSLQEWKLTLLNEEWYTIKSTVNTDESVTNPSTLSFFPNPCKSGESIYLKNAESMPESEALIFDMQGKLVSRENLNNKPGINAPTSAGVYNILTRSEKGILGITKIVVTD